jgi:hypothetical protein
MSFVNTWREIIYSKSQLRHERYWPDYKLISSRIPAIGKPGEVDQYQRTSKNAWGARRGSIMFEKWIHEIGRMERSRKQNEDGVKLMKVENGSGISGDVAEYRWRERVMSKRIGRAWDPLTEPAKCRLKGQEGPGMSSAGGDTDE